MPPLTSQDDAGGYAWPGDRSPLEEREAAAGVLAALRREHMDETVFVHPLGVPPAGETVEVDGLPLPRYFGIDVWTESGFRHVLVAETRRDGMPRVLRRETTSLVDTKDAFESDDRRDSWLGHAMVQLRAQASRIDAGLDHGVFGVDGMRPRGTRVSDSFLEEVIRLRADGLTQQEIAERFGVKHASSASRWLKQAKERGLT